MIKIFTVANSNFWLFRWLHFISNWITRPITWSKITENLSLHFGQKAFKKIQQMIFKFKWQKLNTINIQTPQGHYFESLSRKIPPVFLSPNSSLYFVRRPLLKNNLKWATTFIGMEGGLSCERSELLRFAGNSERIIPFPEENGSYLPTSASLDENSEKNGITT